MVIAIPTKNRTAAFRRCLESVRDNAEKYGREIEFLVVDDSDDGSNRGNQQALEMVGVSYRYYDRQAVADFAVLLSRQAGVPLSLTQFLFKKTPASHGAVRNFLMLMSASEPFIMIDDDMVCKFADIPDRSDEIEYNLSPRVVYPSASLTLPVDETQLIDEDFIGKHEALLNKVPLTVGGFIGDSGVTHSYVFLKTPELLAQIISDPERMFPLLRTRQLLRSTLRPTIVNWCCCVGMSFGLDTSHQLPPFFPVGRGEDVLFGGMLKNCYGGLSGYCNYSMWHTPVRPDTEDALLTLGDIHAPEFMYRLLAEGNPDSLEMFGETLIAISGQDLTPIEGILREWLIDTSRRACKLFNTIPEVVAGEISKMESVVINAPRYDIPYDLIREYGQLLMVWPKIYEVARNYGKQQLSVRLHASTV